MTAPIQTRTEHPKGTTILVLGIVSFFIGILGIVPFLMGKNVKKEIEAGAPYEWKGSKARIGMILGAVFFALFLVGVLLNILLFANR